MSNAHSAIFTRMDSSRTLAMGGIFLLISALLLGEIYAIFIAHTANGFIKQAWAGVMEAISSGDINSVKVQFAIIQDLTEKRGRIMNTHSHIGAFGLLALALVVIQPLLKLSSPSKLLLAWMVVIGAFVQSICTYLSYYVGGWILYIADVAAIVLCVGVAGNIYGLLCQRDSAQATLAATIKASFCATSSMFLAKSGLVLILAGMLFGFYYAWILATYDEVNMIAAITSAVEQIALNNVALAKASILEFKQLQSKIAITSAAHSHAIEFGILAFLLAFVQKFVLLRQTWRRRWARMLVLGGCLLPIFVYLASKYGLRAAAFADLAGALILLSLAAMAFGIIRHTGAIDSSVEQ